MDEEFEMLIEEIKCCETDEDLRLVVENLSNYCENNFQLQQDPLQLAYEQQFKLIKLISQLLDTDFPMKPQSTKDVKKMKDQIQKLELDLNVVLSESGHLHVDLNKLEKQIAKLNEQLQQSQAKVEMYKGNINILKKLSLDELMQLEEQLLKSVATVSNEKNVMIQQEQQKKYDQKLCIICCSKQYSILLKPCGHVCVCEDCIHKIKKCPIDRQQFTKFKRIYLS